jgi:membrane fusion protein (multidrug efflux system)
MTDAVDPEKQTQTNRLRRLLLVVVPVVAVAVGGWFYWQASRYVSTDDAYVKADKLYVAAEVSGRIRELHVHEHQHVKAGELLFTLDARPYRLAETAAEATLAQVANDIEALQASYRQKQAELEQAQADVDYFRRSYERARKLAHSGFSSDSNLDEARHRLESARLHQQVVQRDIDRLLVQLGSPDRPVEDFSAYHKARAALDRARLDLEHTRVVAGMDGVIGPLDIESGDYVLPGKALFAVVSDQHYIEANLKETALTDVRPGQRAEIRIDAYPGRSFPARVTSISPATGSEFSLLPAENASGNWVKVVQRVSVRLALDAGEAIPRLRSGLSVDARIYTDGERGLVPDAAAAAR